MLRFFSTLLLLLSVFACIPKKLPDIPDIGIHPDALNKDLQIEIIPSFNSFKIGEPISILVHLISDIEIETSPNFNARMFTMDTETSSWQEVSEISSHGIIKIPDEMKTSSIVLSLKDNSVRELSVSLYPDLPNRTRPVDLLIIVTGNVIQNGRVSDQKVGAFIIVRLKP